MLHPDIVKGTFRWRKYYKKMPSREQLLKDVKCDFLVNRLLNVMHKYLYKYAGDDVQMLRVRELEFVYIINLMNYSVTLEIMQKEPLSC